MCLPSDIVYVPKTFFILFCLLAQNLKLYKHPSGKLVLKTSTYT